MSQNWLSFITTSPKEKERRETLALLERVKGMQDASPLKDDETLTAFIVDIIDDACRDHGGLPGTPLGGALYATIKHLLFVDSLIGAFPTETELRSYSMEEGVRLRTALRTHERFLVAHERLLPIWREKLVWLFSGLLEYLPPSAFIDVDADGHASDDSVVFPSARAYDLVQSLPELIERLMGTFFDADISDALLFESMRERINRNLLLASGLSLFATEDQSRRIVLPTKSRLESPSALVDAYLEGTPFQGFFYRELPFAIPFPARFEHTHIVGGTGHGKTQLMQFLIHHDLMRAIEDGRSVVVLDSQGDLIRTMSRLSCFSPVDAPQFADRFVLVDPNDIEHPVCLNMFDFNRDRLSGYAPVDREKILNATIELYEYFFGALLGAELTQRQGLIFRYLARLLIEIPDATIHTLRELMEDGERFRPYMEKLTGTSRSFFATQFFDRKFGETKKQILTRLWGVLSNSSLERMFSHPKNRIDIFDLLNRGKIIFINTAKELLGQEGAPIFGRFFIALIAQAAIQRAAMKPHERRPAFVYVDEAQDYFDDNISNLLNQARKYRVGLTFAHQNLDQLNAGLRASVLSSTTIKFAGGVSAKDASALDSEYRVDADFLLGQKKGRTHTEFACFVKNYTGNAISVSIPLGYVEGQPQLSREAYAHLLEENRSRYSEPPLLPDPVSFPPSPTTRRTDTERVARAPTVETFREPVAPLEDVPASPELLSGAHEVPETTLPPKSKKRTPPKEEKKVATPGRGGRQHKYLQYLVKQLAEERGFRASIEETILSGAGRVDVSLSRDTLRVACQISVTTTKDWELGGIEKCLAAGYPEVILIGTSDRHIQSLAKFVEPNLDEAVRGKVRYLTSAALGEYLDGLGMPQTTEHVVKGYKVKTTHKVVDPAEAEARRKAIAGVVARSLKNSTGTS